MCNEQYNFVLCCIILYLYISVYSYFSVVLYYVNLKYEGNQLSLK